MKLTRIIPAILLTLGLSVPATFAQNNQDAQELANSWVRAYNTHDPAGIANLYSENAQLMAHGAPTVRGRQAIRDYWVQDFQEGNPITTLTITHALNGVDMILVHGNYQVIERNDGLVMGQGRFAHIWVLGPNGNWLLDRDMWSDPFHPYQ